MRREGKQPADRASAVEGQMASRRVGEERKVLEVEKKEEEEGEGVVMLPLLLLRILLVSMVLTARCTSNPV